MHACPHACLFRPGIVAVACRGRAQCNVIRAAAFHQNLLVLVLAPGMLLMMLSQARGQARGSMHPPCEEDDHANRMQAAMPMHRGTVILLPE